MSSDPLAGTYAIAKEVLLDPGKKLLTDAGNAILKILGDGSRETVIDHWHEFLEEFHMDPLEFYALVHEECKRRQIPGLKAFCVTHREGMIGTAHRLYLRFDRSWGHFDVCAAPFGVGYFFSYRYIVPTPFGFWLKVFVGILVLLAISAAVWLLNLLSAGVAVLAATAACLLWLFGTWSWSNDTYYKQDTSMMYLSTIPHIIRSVFETVTLQKGARLEDRVTARRAGA